MTIIDRVEMNVPARREYARLIRLAVAGIASRMDFTVDSLEDLKMAIDEAYVIALDDPVQEVFNVAFIIHPDRLEILVPGLGSAESLEDELLQKFGFSILNSVMDKVEWTRVDEGSRNLLMVKHVV
ncbi:MAG: hypothetical protein Q8J63_02390 [Candidatus Aquicultor sp.]|nr:hypothetical protein [Candidatus Aquicultor sp.]